MNKESAFNQLTTKQKYSKILSSGSFLASRLHGSYQVHLFAVDGHYVEVWRSLGMNYIHWIEIVRSARTLEHYVNDIKLDGL